MKRQWSEQELVEHWSLSHDEYELLKHRTGRSRLGFAVVLKFFALEGRFPADRSEIPNAALEYVSEQAAVSKEEFRKYGLTGRSSERDRAHELLGFHAATIEDCEQLTDWLKTQVVPREAKREHILEAALEWLRRNSMEPPSSSQLDRIIGSAVSEFEEQFYAETLEAIPESCRSLMDDLLKASDYSQSDKEPTPFAELRLDPGRPSLDSVLTEIEKLKRIVSIGLPENLFSSIPTSVI